MRDIVQLPEHQIPTLHRQVGPDVGSRNVGVQLHGCSWHLDLHLECGVAFQLLQFSVTNLVCSNSSISREGKKTQHGCYGRVCQLGLSHSL